MVSCGVGLMKLILFYTCLHCLSIHSYPHPYGPELDAFVPAEWMLLDSEPQLYGSLDDTPFTYVDTVEDLQELKQTLLTCKEFAIDTEVSNFIAVNGPFF